MGVKEIITNLRVSINKECLLCLIVLDSPASRTSERKALVLRFHLIQNIIMVIASGISSDNEFCVSRIFVFHL